MDFKLILQAISSYVADYFKDHGSEELLYHNYEHTASVATAAAELNEHYGLSQQDDFVVRAAAWFHDLGYLVDPDNHEAASVVLAENFLKEKQVPSVIIEDVKGCILATRMPQKPKNLLQQIVCDADMSHFSTDSFAEKSKQLRKELQTRCGLAISKNAWRHQTICLLEVHQYHTDYARTHWNIKKMENLEDQLKKDKKSKEGETELPEESAGKKNKKNNGDRPEKGIETMFRITSTNNQRLSDMADKKADILITVNSILLSAILSLLIRKLESNTHLVIPTIIILIVSAVTLIYAILATRPKIPSGVFNQQDVDSKNVNLLFFGNFYRMDFEEYKKGMWKVMEDRDFLYGSLVKDVYSQGIVLGRKYKLLRIAYNVFMFGLMTAIIAFVIAIFSIV
ncbi:Pycsar system effector family protein [Niabella sp. 22666]|uniref:Pycsar system effector family protein n=1 Tax=Niabella sp. 22666 TaxID=3453954 RepID=UPI003F829347